MLNFLSKSTVYEENNDTIVVATSTMITPTSKRTDVDYKWFKKNVGKGIYFSKYWIQESEGIYFHQSFTRWIVCKDWKIDMWLARLKNRGSAARNWIFELKWRYYGQKGYFWTMGKHPHFGILYSYILSRDKRIRGLKSWICKSLESVNHGVKILLIVSVGFLIKEYSTNGNNYYGT